ncbi:hypothetical protein SAMN02745687_00917 [Lachnospiraceae bacterium NK3A20]|nr:hypothetical protein SAMN02745687_00917 [Lachnospiraceae bacterium NK3A20]
MPREKNVTVGKPKVGGAIFRAPVGSTLPTDAKSTLDEAFKEMGYISEDGLTNSNSVDSDTVKAWGGDTVLNLNKGKEDAFKGTFIEALNPEVLKMVYGDRNVVGDIDTGITIKVNNDESQPYSYVFDMILKGNILKRIVLPSAKVTEVGDITYSDGDAVGYETTLSAAPDSNGTTHFEYISAPAASQTVPEG